jgi:hypothetical protein
MMRADSLFGHLAAAASALLASSCFLNIDPFKEDPVHQQQVDALGPEDPAVPRGPMHRPGQPCTVCHGVEGPSRTQFVLAGTVFGTPTETVPVSGADVLLVDAQGTSPPAGSTTTNCAGNFYLTPDVWNPAFPVRVAVSSGQTGVQMITHIGRAGSCASCHTDPISLSSPGHVFAGAVTGSAGNCSSPGGTQ